MFDHPIGSRSPIVGRHKRARIPEKDRRRTVRACDSCRKQKERCEGGVPCRRCLRLRRTCQFQMTTASIEGGLPSGGPTYPIDLDKEKLKTMERIVKHFIGNVPNELADLRKLAEALDERRQSYDSIDNEVEDDYDDLAMADESFTVKEFTENAAHYSGELSHWNFSERVQREIDSLEIEDPQNRLSSEKEIYRPKHLQSSGPSFITIAQGFPPQPIAEFLVSIFFKYGQTNYFYVDEEWAIAKLETIYKQTSSASSDDSPLRCILLMLLAIGTQFVNLDSVERSDESGGDHNNESSVEYDLGITLYRLAIQLIPDVLTIASLESVQAFVLLGLYTLPLDTSGLSYTYLGMAIKMAVQNGMHRKYTGISLDAHAQEVRKRLWWTVYTLEKRICVLQGRPLSISASDVDAELPADMPHFHPPNYANLRAIIMLTSHLEAVAAAITLLRNAPKSQQTNQLLELVKQSESLKASWSSLPSETYCRDLDPQKVMFRANVHLTLAFLLTQVFVGRPFLFTRNRGSPSSTPSRSKATMAQATLAHDCVEAAHQILDLCQLLEDHGGLTRSSYLAFSSCSAALLVFIAHSLNGNTKRLRNALTNGMQLMRLMTRGVDSAKPDSSIIKLLERAISRLNAQSELRTSNLNQRQPSRYETYKNWAQLWKQKSPQAQNGPIETNQQPTENAGISSASESTGFPWPPLETNMWNFALDPSFAYSQLDGGAGVLPMSNGVYQLDPAPDLGFGWAWVGQQMSQ